MCFGPILHQKSKNVNFVKFDEFPSHRVRTANRALGCTDLDKQDGNTFPILDHEIKRKQFSLVAPVVALPRWWPCPGV